MGKDDFLNLLVTQLQNQDPLNPTDQTEFTAQLAQFSSLEQLSNINTNLEQLQNFQASTNNSQAVSLLGKEITADGNFLQLTGTDPVGCNFNLAADAATVVATVYDSTGEYVTSIEEKNLAAGKHTLYWDGTDKNGNPVAAGSYTFEMMAADAAGDDIEAKPFFSGTVDKVTFENDTPFLISADRKIALADVIQVSALQNSAENTQLEDPNTASINGGN